MADPYDTLIVGPLPIAEPTGEGPLSGLTFVAKDLLDVVGHRTGAGNPDVLDAAVVAERNAWAVDALLRAGATCIGKAHTAETAYSLSGLNEHYGTPRHPVDPARDPGGSSSGSAVAVAAGICDVALGTDTGGSVRVPASYCGVAGIRPTHGRVPLDGVFPLAPRFDTVGWFARDGELLRRVGAALLDVPVRRSPIARRLLVASDLFARGDPAHSGSVNEAIYRLSDVVGRSPEPIRLCRESEVEQWPAVFTTLQRDDAWRTNRHWIQSLRPRFGPTIARRWEAAAAVSAEEVAAAERQAALLCEGVWELLSGDTVLVLPAAPGPAPRLDDPGGDIAATRERVLTFSSIASVARVPQVSLPLLELDGLPVGIGLMASPGNDELLLELAARLV